MRNAAVINRCDEPGDVPNNSAAEADDKRLSVKPCSDHLIANRTRLLKRLRFLAYWNRDQHMAKTRCRQAFLYAPGEKRGNLVIGNYCARFAREIFVYVLTNLLNQA